MSEHQMSERWWGDAERDPIHAAAAQWFTRLQDPQVSIEATLDWQRWMSEDLRNAEAFARIEETWNTLGEVSLVAATAAADSDSYDGSTPLSDVGSRDPVRHRRRMIAVAASVLATILLALAVTHRDWLAGWRSGVQVLHTGIGENRSVRLEDGSRVILGGGTELEVLLQQDSRRISLLRGEAFFKVARDSSRPFVVRAGETAVTAVGTEFNVRRGGDRVTIAVIEGRVVVERSSALIPLALLREFRPKLRPIRVEAGQQTKVDDRGVEHATQLADPRFATAWQAGRLAYERELLRYVLADVNRYAVTPIVAEDQSIESLSITGTVASDNVAEWLESLESAFGLVAVEEAGRIVLKRRLARERPD
jgi:transmembrane sensor